MAEIRAIYGKIKLTDEASGAINKLKESMNHFKEGLHNVNNVMEAIGGAYLIEKIREFGAEMVHAAAEEETQMLRLKHLAGEGYDAVKESIEGAVEASHGLADDSDMATAANSALKLGASIDFVKNNLQSMQQLSKVMGTDINETFSGMQNAINTGSIRFLRQSPILVQHIAEFKKIGAGYDEVTKKRREMFMTQILSNEQAKILQQYNEYLETTEALSARVSTQWHKMKEVIGNLILVALRPIIKYLGLAMEWLMKDKDHIALFKIGVIGLASALTILLIPALISTISSFAALIGVSKGFLMTVGGIALAITTLVLVIEDLYQMFTGGESVAGDWGKMFKAMGDKKGQFRFELPGGKGVELGGALSGYAGIGRKVLDFNNAVGGAVVGGVKSLFGGKKAAGGPVSGGKSYLTGERGPELFTPSVGGNITPNHALGGITIGSLIGSLTIQAGSGEIGQSIESEVMDALNKLSRTIMRNELGMAAV
jgi:hypothetical protein